MSLYYTKFSAHAMTHTDKSDYRHLALFWNDMLYLMANKSQALSSTGPFRTMLSNAKLISNELIEINERMANFNVYMTKYYQQLADTWTEAQKKVDLKVGKPSDPAEYDAYKRVWIDVFDNDFTELFDSEKFGANYGKLVSEELEMAKHWNNMASIVLKSVNVPSRKEMNEVYQEVNSLRKRVAALESELRSRRRDEAKSA